MIDRDDLLEEVVLEWNMLQENLVGCSEQFKPVMDKVVEALQEQSAKEIATDELRCRIVEYNWETQVFNDSSTVDAFNKVIRALNRIFEEMDFPETVIECPAEYDDHHHNGTTAWDGTIGPEDEETLYPHDEEK